MIDDTIMEIRDCSSVDHNSVKYVKTAIDIEPLKLIPTDLTSGELNLI